MRILIPIALIAAALALVLAVRFLKAPDAGTAIGPPALGTPPAAGPDRPAPGLVREPAVEPPGESAGPNPAPTVTAPSGLEERALPRPGDFSALYEGWSDERLGERLRELELLVQNDTDRLFKDRFERGLFDIHDVGLEEPDWDALAIGAPEGEVGRGRLRFIDGPPGGKGRREYQFSTLPRSEYRDFYGRLDERDWLRMRLSEQDQDLR